MDALKRHEPLYLKYRPQSLSELVGQSAVTRTLTNAIESDRLAHAYLFTGPRGTGKTSSARILAKSLNCKSSDQATVHPCNQCASCLEVKTGISPAVLEIDAASNNSVDDARILIERAPLVAPGGRYKIYIIDECHMLTKEAFNALLKTIEDPPPNVIFVLATTEEHKVIPTIISRCQRLMFRLVTQSDLTQHLRYIAGQENISISDEALSFIARRSGGGLRDALSLLDQASLLSSPETPVTVNDLLALLGALHEDVLLDMSEQILNRQAQNLLVSLNKLLSEGREPSVVVQELSRHCLNLIKAAYLSHDPAHADTLANLVVGSPQYLERLAVQSAKFDRSELSQMVESLDRLEQTCRRTTQPAMHLEVGLLALCHRHDMVLVHELAERVKRLESGLSAPSLGQAPRAPMQAAPAAQPAPAAAPPAPAPVPPTPAVQPAPAESPAAVLPPAPDSVPERHTPNTVSVYEPTESQPAVLPSDRQAIDVDDPFDVEPDEEKATYTSKPASPVINDAPALGQSEAANPRSAAPASQPPANASLATAAAEATDSDESSGEDLDHVWSQTLDELHRRHLPTYSLASTHAFPLRLTATEFSIGVTKEALQKTLEGKQDHIKAACFAVVGRPLHLKIRHVPKDQAAVKSQASPAPVRPSPAQASSGKHNQDQNQDQDQDEDDLAGPRLSADAAATNTQPQEVIRPPAGDSDNSQIIDRAAPAQRPAMQAAAPAVLETAGAALISGALPGEGRGNDSTIVKEAYRLFEGPGSRRVGGE